MADIITLRITPPNPAAGRAAFIAACLDWGNKVNGLAIQHNDAVDAVNSAATAATDAMDDAVAARDATLAAAGMVASTWTSGNDYDANELVWSDATINAVLYRCFVAIVNSTTAPAADAAHFAPAFVKPSDFAALQAKVDRQLDVQTFVKAAAYVLALEDRGHRIETNAGVTIPKSDTVAFPDGASIVIYNRSANNIALTPAAEVTLRKAGTATTGAVNIAPYGLATVSRTATVDVWVVTGTLA